MSISGAAKIAGVMGWPIAHSLSPLLHGYWLAENRIDGAMVPLPVRPEHFSVVLTALHKAGFRGVNVTVPHKEAAFAVAHDCDAAALAAGAVNLLVFHPDGRLEGRNTDAVGLGESLKEKLDDSLRGKHVVLLGAGGAARGAVLALGDQGVAAIHILNRDGARARALCAAMMSAVPCKLLGGSLQDWHRVAGEASLLVNATSAGMNGKNPLDLALDILPDNAAVCDIVYKPLETDLLKRARARGLVCIDGLGMLMHQAAPSFEAFYGVKPKVSAGLRAALEQALARA